MRFVVPIACLILLWFFVDIGDSLVMLWQIPMSFVFTCTGVYLLRNWICGLRWLTLLPLSHNQISRWGAFRYIMVGGLYGLILPGTIGGDVARSAHVAIEVPENKTSYVISIWLDRSIGLFSILILGALAGLTSQHVNNRLYFLLFMAVGILFFLLIVWVTFHPSLHSFILRASSRYKKIQVPLTQLLANLRVLANHHRANKPAVWKALGYCVPIHGLAFLVVYLIAGALDIEVGFLALSLFTAISWLATTLPLSFAGVGVRELSFVVMLQTQGISAELATSLSLGFFSIMVLTGLAGAFFLLIPHTREPQMTNTA